MSNEFDLAKSKEYSLSDIFVNLTLSMPISSRCSFVNNFPYCHFYNDQEIWNLDGAISLCSDGYTLKNVCDNGEYTILIMVKSLCKK